MWKNLLAPLYISDLLFPVWLLVILFICKKKKIDVWKGWCLASSFCVVQSLLVAFFIGWNAGAYFLYFLFVVPLAKTGLFEKEHLSILFYLAPPIGFILIPAVVLYFLQNLSKRAQKG